MKVVRVPLYQNSSDKKQPTLNRSYFKDFKKTDYDYNIKYDVNIRSLANCFKFFLIWSKFLNCFLNSKKKICSKISKLFSQSYIFFISATINLYSKVVFFNISCTRIIFKLHFLKEYMRYLYARRVTNCSGSYSLDPMFYTRLYPLQFSKLLTFDILINPPYLICTSLFE